MESVDEGQPFAVIVDYAHSPEAIRSVLREVRHLAKNRVMVLFGSAGERDVGKRAVQGAIAVTDADFAVFTSEDPRFEDPDAIVDDIAVGAREAGGRAGVDFECIEDRREAIARILDRAESGDVIVLAGKGHERSMIYGDAKRPWHEANVARELLRAMGYRKP
jgi:UDP-N-acetylmuramoyl-L-alanyl-D-glutamate--2,6-diaminopimelate ligase